MRGAFQIRRTFYVEEKVERVLAQEEQSREVSHQEVMQSASELTFKTKQGERNQSGGTMVGQ